MRSNKSNSRLGILVSLVFFFLLLLGAEISIKLLLPEGRLDQILKVLQRDNNLIWRQREFLDTDFFSENIKTNSMGFRNHELAPKKKSRLLVLGASPSFGWGVRSEDTYSRLVESSSRFSVINGSQIGFSSFQGLEMLKSRIDDLVPDVVTVSYVINDVDRFRFFENNGIEDANRKRAGDQSIWFSNVISKLQIWRILRRGISFFNSQKSVEVKSLPARVSIDNYRKNLLEFVSMSKKYNFKLIFIKMPVNLPLITANNNSRYQSASLLASNDSIKYNKVMEDVARSHSLKLVDIVSSFKKHEGEYLFVDRVTDTIHPNKLGHAIIAHELLLQLE